MHLNTNVVVLSSCNSAVGLREGEEGVSTLSNSFLLVGAKSVVSTLWSVEDPSSLVPHFWAGSLLKVHSHQQYTNPDVTDAPYR